MRKRLEFEKVDIKEVENRSLKVKRLKV